MWSYWCRKILRSTPFATSSSHHSPNWRVFTFSSDSPCTTYTLAVIFDASGR